MTIKGYYKNFDDIERVIKKGKNKGKHKGKKTGESTDESRKAFAKKNASIGRKDKPILAYTIITK